MSDVESMAKSIYICFSTFLLTCVGFKVQTVISNFKDYIAVLLIFLVAIFCHMVALKAAKTCWPTTIISHVSGVIACEALLWVFVTEWLYCIVGNVVMALVVVLIYHKDILNLLAKCFPKISKSDIPSRDGQEVADTEVQKADSEELKRCSCDRY